MNRFRTVVMLLAAIGNINNNRTENQTIIRSKKIFKILLLFRYYKQVPDGYCVFTGRIFMSRPQFNFAFLSGSSECFFFLSVKQLFCTLTVDEFDLFIRNFFLFTFD